MRLGLCARTSLESWEWPPATAAAQANVYAESLDVRDESRMTQFAGAVVERFGAIDLWINNAGVLDPIGPLRDQSLASIAENLSINVTALALGCQLFVRHLRRRRAVDPGATGVLINISSGAARKAYSGWGAYCASKAAVDRLTECLQLEEGAAGLQAYSVAPGVIDTEMQAKIRACDPEQFPDVGRFMAMARDDTFSSGGFVAEQLLEIAFGSQRSDLGAHDVLLRLPSEHEVRDA